MGGLRQRQERNDSANAVKSEDQEPDECQDEGKKDAPSHGEGMHHPSCRRFLASPVWKSFTLVVVGFTPVFGVGLALPELLSEINITRGSLAWMLNYVVAAWISAQFLFNFMATQWTDPGSCKTVKPHQEVTGQFAVGGSNDAPKLLYAPNWCTKCANWKPPRSHHCSMSQRCVLRMDHFCPFTGNCIGANNHGHFILFYIFSFLGLLYSLVLCLAAVYRFDHYRQWKAVAGARLYENRHVIQQQTHFMMGVSGLVFSVLLEILAQKGIAILVQLVATIMALTAVLSTGIPAFQLAWTNTTTMERLFPMKEYVQLKEQIYCPLGPGFYRLSGVENLKQILGPRWLWRLFLPLRGGMDLGVALSPPPSAEGAKALWDRLQQVKEQGVQNEVRSCKDLGFDPGPGNEPSNV
mmetsp:Transcript_53933/g.101111  ORF Transcript_53933/g.101111 Transcript_53933/m.101111 type:complete len:409 (+) Transcript_53933:50-1276(+)